VNSWVVTSTNHRAQERKPDGEISGFCFVGGLQRYNGEGWFVQTSSEYAQKNGSEWFALVILTKDGELYLPISHKMPDTEQRQQLMPFLEKYARASGIGYERKGTHAIVIDQSKELKDICI
jgi:hypothetical protein